MPDLELIPDRDLLSEIVRRFEDAAFIGIKTRCPPTNQGQLVIQTTGCLYRLETLCADLCGLIQAKRLANHHLEDWEEG